MRKRTLPLLAVLAVALVASVFAANRITRGVALIGELQLDNPLDIAYLEPQLQQQADDVTFTSAQLLAINTTEIEAVAAPGAGYAIIFDGAICEYDYATTGYTIGTLSGLAFKYTDDSGAVVGQIDETGFIDQSADETRWVSPFAAASGDSDIEPVANAALVFHGLTADPTDGDGTVTCRIFYRRIPATLP